jgi:hypothetical protein
LLFLRPRRFGKSLLLSMLENYYDLRKADEFERLFGRLAIGRSPTPKHNQYFVMRWDFSAVSLRGRPSKCVSRCITTSISAFGTLPSTIRLTWLARFKSTLKTRLPPSSRYWAR